MFFLSPLFMLISSWNMVMTNGLNVEDFFPNIKQNLTKITWAHAVNDKAYLNSTLNDDGINMIEADVVMGILIDNGSSVASNKLIPIMAHPPVNTSNLSLKMFLDFVETFNLNATITTKKGIKLDFKSTDAFNNSTETVSRFDKGSFPIWINADILPGPIDKDPPTVDVKSFLEGSKLFPNSTLSIGWTTNKGDSDTGSYNSDQIDDMIKIIQENNVTQNITFPVRAGFAAKSIDLLANLIERVPNSTITIWSSKEDSVEISELRLLIKKIGLNKTFIDVPKDILDQLHLDNLPNWGSPLKNSVWLTGLMMLILSFGVIV